MRIISVVGYKKTGKTALVERLVKALKKNGKVGTVKHLHETRINTQGTDTWKHMQAGASVVIGVTPEELVKFSQKNNLTSALDELADAGMDFGLVEGFKDSILPKIALGDVEASNVVRRIYDIESSDLEELIKIIFNQPEYHTLESLIHKLKSSKDFEKAGAIGTFTGVVRAETRGVRTEFLEFEEYREIALQKMNRICSELREREGIIDAVMHHRTGIIAPGEDIVYIAVAAAHRDELFPVLREAIERLKMEVPIWKKEHTAKGEWWVREDKGSPDQ